MGYFSNGAEGMDYMVRYCDRCANESEEQGCAVWNAHFLYAYSGTKEQKAVLDELIPRTADKLGNEQCRMFRAK